MKILVCVKQVPDLEQLSIEETAGGEVFVGDIDEYRMNRFDEYAVEAAMLIKEGLGAERDVTVHAITVGPERTQDVVRRAMGMGADHGIHIPVVSEIEPEPALVARRIAAYARNENYDLILCGSMSEDGMHGQVGSMIAALLKRAGATHVIDLQLAGDCTEVALEREIEGGARELLKMRLPAVLSLQSGINRPRYPSFSNLMRANRQELEIVSQVDAAQSETTTLLSGLILPPRTRAGRILEGNAVEKAQQLLTFLKEKALVH